MLYDTAEFFFELSSAVKLRFADIICCIEKLSGRESFSSLDFLRDFAGECTDGCNIKEVWCNCVNASSAQKFFSPSALNLLCAFSENFGKLPPDSFAEKCRLYSESFRALAISENEKWEKNRTLIMSSGVLSAAAVFFILI